jgi:hypothetical protein
VTVPPADISSAVKSSEPTPSFSAESPTPVLTPSSSTSSISPPSSTGSPAPESLPISPAPSHASLDFSFTSSVSPASPLPSSTQESESESTRHLARVATTRETLPCVSLQRVNSNSTPLTSTIPKATILSPISQCHPWTPSMMRQWKLSSMRSSTATLAPPRQSLPTQAQGQQRPRVYKLLIVSRLPNQLKGVRRRRRVSVTHRRR